MDLPENLIDLAAQRGASTVPGYGGRSIEEILADVRRKHRESMISVPYAPHPIMPSAVEESCLTREFSAGRDSPCGNRATHKLGEQGGDPSVHELTAYVCCEHFRAVMGRCTVGG